MSFYPTLDDAALDGLTYGGMYDGFEMYTDDPLYDFGPVQPYTIVEPIVIAPEENIVIAPDVNMYSEQPSNVTNDSTPQPSTSAVEGINRNMESPTTNTTNPLPTVTPTSLVDALCMESAKRGRRKLIVRHLCHTCNDIIHGEKARESHKCTRKNYRHISCFVCTNLVARELYKLHVAVKHPKMRLSVQNNHPIIKCTMCSRKTRSCAQWHLKEHLCSLVTANGCELCPKSRDEVMEEREANTAFDEDDDDDICPTVLTHVENHVKLIKTWHNYSINEVDSCVYSRIDIPRTSDQVTDSEKEQAVDSTAVQLSEDLAALSSDDSNSGLPSSNLPPLSSALPATLSDTNTEDTQGQSGGK